MSGLYRVQPLTDFTIFTTPASKRKPVQFKAPWASTSRDLKRELDYLDATDVILEIAVKPAHIRVDGELRADVPKELPHPGVRLSLQARQHGALSYSCDTYAARYYGQMPDWQANVRAIVLTLESLRAIDRYGATKGEQYAGFKALGAGTGGVALGGMTRDEAIFTLDDYADRDWALNVDGPRVYRLARAGSHPDRHNGDRTAWDRVEAAAKVLGLSS